MPYINRQEFIDALHEVLSCLSNTEKSSFLDIKGQHLMRTALGIIRKVIVALERDEKSELGTIAIRDKKRIAK